MAAGIRFFVVLVLLQAALNVVAGRRAIHRRRNATCPSSRPGKACPEVPDFVRYTLSYVTNQPAELYVNYWKISENPGVASQRVVKDFSGPCKDIIVKLTNTEDEEPVAIAAKIEYKGTQYGTRQIIKVETTPDMDEFTFIKVVDPSLPDVIPLYATSMENPPGNFTKPGFDFSPWKPPRLVDSVLDEPFIEFLRIQNEGAVPLNWMDGPKEKGETFGLRIFLPFCYCEPVTNFM